MTGQWTREVHLNPVRCLILKILLKKIYFYNYLLKKYYFEKLTPTVIKGQKVKERYNDRILHISSTQQSRMYICTHHIIVNNNHHWGRVIEEKKDRGMIQKVVASSKEESSRTIYCFYRYCQAEIPRLLWRSLLSPLQLFS